MSETAERPTTSAGLQIITADDYGVSGEASGKARRNYIESIVTAHGASISSEWMPSIDEHSESVLVQQFFRSFENEGYGPQSRLGQLVQMLACEVSAQNRISSLFSSRSAGVQERNIPSGVEVLTEIRKAKKSLAEEIFGDQRDQYLPVLQSTFFMHRNKEEERRNPKQAKKARDQQLRVVVQQIAQAFPTTSK